MSKTVKKFDNFIWIDIFNPDREQLNELKKEYNLHYNALEDAMEHGHLPKIEKVNEFNFFILRAFSYNKITTYTTVDKLTAKVAFFVRNDAIITIHNTKFFFLSENKNNYRQAEELMLDIIREIQNSYKKFLDHQSRKINEFEESVFLESDKSLSIKEIYYYKSKSHTCNNMMKMTEEVLKKIEVTDPLKSNLQDIKETVIDNIIQSEKTENDIITLLNVYLSIASQKTNDIMKLLTVFSAFFLPLSFIVGLYGMNFKYMPELNWHYGYLISILAMITISIFIFCWFKRKKIL